MIVVMSLTIVSGYWIVKNKHDMNFIDWFNNTLKINAPYVFFGNAESIELVKPYREGLPTFYIECNIEDFYSYKYKDKIFVDEFNCPSKELVMIWNEKIFLVEFAAKLNPFSSDFFMWADAGACVYRDEPPPSTPFPNPIKLSEMPTDKFIYSSSIHERFQPEHVGSHLDHHVAGTAYLIHISLIKYVFGLYNDALEKYSSSERIITDQILWTHIYAEHPELFHKLGDGYGSLIPLLY